MAKTNKERVLDYLWSVAPEGATNAQIREATGITSHQSVYMLTQELKRQGLIAAKRPGREWVFFADESAAAQLSSPGRARPGRAEGTLTPAAFESLAGRVLSDHYGVPLAAAE